MTNRLGIVEVIGDKREAILALAEKYHAYNVQIFGSVARGEATPDSDVDFLVEFQPDYSLLDHAGLLVSLQKLLGRRVDVTIASQIREAYRPYILKDVVPI